MISSDEIIIDSFAGGGGASVGIEMALGRSPDVAINHDPEAVAMHTANHPNTEHYCQNIWQAIPKDVVRGRTVGLAWFSPDCKHFSKAKGSALVDRNIRDLPWTVVEWAEQVRPKKIVVENVEEFKTWGPIFIDGKICPDRKGETFKKWVNSLKRAGYHVEYKELRACDFGAPTIRKRLFVIAVLKKTGERIIWPKPTHGKPGSPEVLSGKLLPWRTAADIIDFSLPCPSIFMSQQEAKAWRMATGQSLKRPLAEATMRRIAQGLKKFVFQASDPFIVTANHQGNNFRGQGLTEPFKTITASRDAHGLVMPYLTEHANATSQRTWSGNEPLRTQCANVKGGHFALAQAFLAKHYGGVVGTEASNPFPTITTRGTQTQLVTAHIDRQFGGSEGHGIDEPSGTITAGGSGKSALVSSNLIKMRGTCRHGQKTDQPTPTITAGGMHIGEVRAFLQKYYGCENGQSQSCAEPMHTVPTKQRFGLVTVDGEDYQITDIGMRMLTPKELFSAQGFPDSYKIDIDYNGKKLTKTAQIRMCGNSVCPPLAKAIIQANFISTNQMQAAE